MSGVGRARADVEEGLGSDCILALLRDASMAHCADWISTMTHISNVSHAIAEQAALMGFTLTIAGPIAMSGFHVWICDLVDGRPNPDESRGVLIKHPGLHRLCHHTAPGGRFPQRDWGVVTGRLQPSEVQPYALMLDQLTACRFEDANASPFEVDLPATMVVSEEEARELSVDGEEEGQKRIAYILSSRQKW